MAAKHPIKPPKRRATSYDVAALAGVSQSAVSRCFQAGASISEKTRQKVMEAAAALHYQPNAIARGLITRRSHLAGVIVSAKLNMYYPEVLFELSETFAANDMRVLLFNVHDPQEVDAALDQLWRYQVDGVISASYLARDQYERLETRGTPVVLFNRFFTDRPTEAIWCDPSQATKQLIDHLVSLGHRRFAMLEGPADNHVNLIRKEAVTQSLTAHGLALSKSIRGDYTYESARPALADFKRTEPHATALICANDMMAMGAIDTLRADHGLNVPADISVTGFDGIGASRFTSYALTTIRQPIEDMAQLAVKRLLGKIEDPTQKRERTGVAGSFILGQSTAVAH